MLRPLMAFALLLWLSCADKEPPVAPSAFDEQAGPWQTIEINGATYRRAAAKANATTQSSDVQVTIPIRNINGQISLADSVFIEGHIYTANCSAPGNPSEDGPSVSINPDRAVLIAFYRATGGGTAWTGDNWGSDEPIGSWEGVTTNADGRVTFLNLPKSQLSDGEQLSGFIPAELGLLTHLTSLILSGNDLSGSIPPELGQLTHLILLYLDGNDLSGSIPSALGNLTNLTLLLLSTNDLSGTIPVELGNLSNLEWLFLSGNDLSGTIPVELGQLSNLEWLYLDSNDLSGSIPSELGNLSNLQALALSRNALSGSIPAALGDLTTLTTLFLSHNALSGSLPTALGQLINLTWLTLSNNELSGTIPSELGQLTNLKQLRVCLATTSAGASLPVWAPPWNLLISLASIA